MHMQRNPLLVKDWFLYNSRAYWVEYQITTVINYNMKTLPSY